MRWCIGIEAPYDCHVERDPMYAHELGERVARALDQVGAGSRDGGADLSGQRREAPDERARACDGDRPVAVLADSVGRGR